MQVGVCVCVCFQGGDTCVNEEEVKNVVSHGDVIALSTQANRGRPTDDSSILLPITAALKHEAHRVSRNKRPAEVELSYPITSENSFLNS